MSAFSITPKNVIYIKKRTLPQWMTLFVFAAPFFLPMLLQLFNLPGLVKYAVDVVWLGLLFVMCFRKRIEAQRKLVPFMVFVLLLFTYSFVVYLFNYQSPFYFLWGIRNNYRFYIAFFACATFFDEEDTTSFFSFLNIIFWINAIVSVVQFAFLGFKQDFLGGIFGVDTGCNASTIIFFSTILSRSVLLYLEGKEKALLCWSKCVIALLLAALAELKFFFVVFMLILLISMVMTKASWKKIILFIIVALLILVANAILGAYFESNISFESFLRLLTSSNYSSAKDLGRLTAIPTISRTILTDTPSRLFGMGLGNCDTASFSICNTPFFQAHQNLHYTWFSSAFLFLEIGYVGLVLQFGFYIICFVSAFKMLRRQEGNRLYNQMAMIMSLLCVILVFYNSSLRTEAGYMAYFVLALPFISKSTAQEV